MKVQYSTFIDIYSTFIHKYQKSKMNRKFRVEHTSIRWSKPREQNFSLVPVAVSCDPLSTMNSDIQCRKRNISYDRYTYRNIYTYTYRNIYNIYLYNYVYNIYIYI